MLIKNWPHSHDQWHRALSQEVHPRFSSEAPLDDDQQEDGLDGINEVTMALDLRRPPNSSGYGNNTLGCAYYVAVDEALFLQEDIPMADLQMVETMLVRVQPTTVIIPSRSTPELVESLQNHAQDMYDRCGGM